LVPFPPECQELASIDVVQTTLTVALQDVRIAESVLVLSWPLEADETTKLNETIKKTKECLTRIGRKQ